MERMLSVQETAKALGLCLDTVRRQLRAGKLPGIQMGRTWRVPESQLKAHLGLVAGLTSVNTSCQATPGQTPPGQAPTHHSHQHPQTQTVARNRGKRETLSTDEVAEEVASTDQRTNRDSNSEVIHALLRTSPARTEVLALARQATQSVDLSPEAAQQLLEELNRALRRL